MDLTGYPSIDRPWEKHHKAGQPYEEDKSFFCQIYENNKAFLHTEAIRFLAGTSITWNEVFDKVYLAVRALVEYGAKKNDWISIFSTNIPEYIYLSLAASYLGVRMNLIPFYGEQAKKKIADSLNITESKLFFVMDALHSDEVKEAVKHSKVRETIVIPALNSSRLKGLISFLRYLKKPRSLFRRRNKHKTWNKFIQDGQHRALPEEASFEANKPAIVVNTSGSTSGSPKGVVYSTEALIHNAKSHYGSVVSLARGTVCYPIVPNAYATGASKALFSPMFYGAVLFLDPRFSQEAFIANLLKYDIHHVIAPTTLWEGFLNKELVNKYYHPSKRNLKTLLYPFQGGEAQSPEKARSVQDAMKALGFERYLLNAYGTSENGPALSMQVSKILTPGSSGVPMRGLNFRVLDDEGNLLKVNEAGELQVHNPKCSMLGYLGDKEATEDYFTTDAEGVRWNKLGDYGYINGNGELFVLGRADDFVLVNGKKIYNFLITKILENDEDILSVSTYTGKVACKQEAVVHIVLKGEAQLLQKTNPEYTKNKVRQLQKLVLKAKGDIDWVPENFKFYEAFPTLANIKRNVGKMKSETKGIITAPKESLLEEAR